jgi:uncharacterized protein (DUF1800 family)
MKSAHLRVLFGMLPLVIAAAGPAFVRGDEAKPPLTEEQRIVHALNRLGFGPRPGDVEKVKQIGLDAWIRQQLHPEKIADPAAEKALVPLETLKMDTGHFISQVYEEIKYFLELQSSYGNAEDMKMRTGFDLDKSKQVKPQEAKPKTLPIPDPLSLSERHSIGCIAELQQAKLMRAALSEKQLQEVLVDFWTNHFNVDIRKNNGRALYVEYDRDVIRPRVLGKFRDLLGATAHSPAMLQYLDNNENAVARTRSKFEQTMIEWYISYKLGYRIEGALPDKEGPNENYGRELLELHTLGVDGGYTQKDVQEVARCFTGWSSNPITGAFNFELKRHDQGEKTVLGAILSANGGQRDGEIVLDLLARHPSTAKFISRKLCQRFVADDPPASLVEKVAKVFTETDGDIRRVVEAIVTSKEFFAPAAVRTKIKSPFEYAASAVRATSGEFTGRGWGMFGKLSYVQEGGALIGNDPNLSKAKTKTLNWHVHDMGEPLFAHAAPQGYPEQSSKWVSPGALIDRMNFAIALSEQNVKDIKADVRGLVRDVPANDREQIIDRLAQQILHQPLSAATRATLLKSLGDGKKVDVKKAAGLIIGSPEFQRR